MRRGEHTPIRTAILVCLLKPERKKKECLSSFELTSPASTFTSTSLYLNRLLIENIVRSDITDWIGFDMKKAIQKSDFCNFCFAAVFFCFLNYCYAERRMRV